VSELLGYGRPAWGFAPQAPATIVMLMAAISPPISETQTAASLPDLVLVSGLLYHLDKTWCSDCRYLLILRPSYF